MPHDILQQGGGQWPMLPQEICLHQIPIVQRMRGVLGFEGNMLSLEEVFRHLDC